MQVGGNQENIKISIL